MPKVPELFNKTETPAPPAEEKKSDSKSDYGYFRTPVFGMQVVVGDPDPTKGEVAPKVLRFQPFWHQERGVEGWQKVGVLKTNVGSALKKLRSDINVKEIDEKEYELLTTPARDVSGKQYAGLRAPY